MNERVKPPNYRPALHCQFCKEYEEKKDPKDTFRRYSWCKKHEYPVDLGKICDDFGQDEQGKNALALMEMLFG